MTTAIRLFWVPAAFLLFSGALFGQATELGIEVIDGPESISESSFGYRKQWLVVVGINYGSDTEEQESNNKPGADEERSKKKPPTLRNAQSDAKAVHELLIQKFGFENHEKSLLIGKDADGKTIRDVIGRYEVDDAVKEEDCVLVYFSGHGVLQKSPADNSLTGLLLPDDIELQANGAVNRGTAIEMNFIVKSLMNCPARHKFLVLDCCHSGAVFRLDDINFDKESIEQDSDSFKSKGFQVLTASRDNQKASDGRDGHSPFTNALLVSLKTLPLLVEQTQGHRGFTVGQLFEVMKPHLRRDGISSPQNGHIGGDLGQFYFLPIPSADFRESITDDLERNQLLAMTPTTFGNWWAHEVPWFMPGLRLAILQRNPSSRSMSDELDPKCLLDAAKDAISQSAKEQTVQTPLQKMRYRHLDELIAAKNQEGQKVVMRAIIKEMEAHIISEKQKITEINSDAKDGDGHPERIILNAEDFHYLAVLHQLMGDPETAENHYRLALEKYGDSNSQSGNQLALGALCLLDAGTLSTTRREYESAKLRFKQAQERLGENTPWPFRVFALCREAEVYRREGRFQLSEDRLDIAVQILQRFDAEQNTLLSANTMKVRAWAHMEGWDFENASRDFLAAKNILAKFDQTRFESSIDQLHVLHGQAMIERFQGRSTDSLDKYRELTRQIATHLSQLENSLDAELLNYTEVRSLLHARLVNSLERQADCLLFGETPDYAEAADDYRRAIHQCRAQGEDGVHLQLIDLLYRRAIAVCLNSLGEDPSGLPNDTANSEFELAKWTCAEAEELLERAQSSKEVIDLPFKTKTVQKMAYACLRLQKNFAETLAVKTAGYSKSIVPNDQSEVLGSTSCFTDMLLELNREAIACDRDELERLMFLHRVLIDYREQFRIEPYQSLKHIDQLLAYCRSACRLKEPDPKLLAYLRPYYDTAFLAHSELLPGHTKELIEISYEATRGTAYRKSGAVQPLLAMYVARERCFLLVDAPGSVSRTFIHPEFASVEKFVAASEAEFPMPDEVRHVLRTIKKEPDQAKVELRWRDPVLGIGVEERLVTLRPNFDKEYVATLPETADEMVIRFPFSLVGIPQFEYLPDENPLCVKKKAKGEHEESVPRPVVEPQATP